MLACWSCRPATEWNQEKENEKEKLILNSSKLNLTQKFKIKQTLINKSKSLFRNSNRGVKRYCNSQDGRREGLK